MLGQSQKGKYITIYQGKITESYKTPIEGSIERTNKEGKQVYEIYHDWCEGNLVNVRTKGLPTDQYGKSWIFDLKDGEEIYHLQLSYSNSYATAFLKMLPNIDLAEKIKITPDLKTVEGKTRSALFINQDEQPIKHAFTKDNPNGLPPLVKTVISGKDVWDDTAQLAFFEDMVNTQIRPKLEKINRVTSTATIAADKEQVTLDEEPEIEKANSLDDF